MDRETGIGLVLAGLPSDMVPHLNRMPDQLELVVAAAEPSMKTDWRLQTKLYELHRADYLHWTAERAAEQGAKFHVEARVPSRNARTSQPETTLMTLGPESIVCMKAGKTPPGWNVEHVSCRYLVKGDGQSANRIGNLQIMPAVINRWTATLEQLQFESGLFTEKWKSPSAVKATGGSDRTLILCARPKQGPSQGFLFFGAKEPQTSNPVILAKWRDLDISQLPRTSSMMFSRAHQVMRPTPFL